MTRFCPFAAALCSTSSVAIIVTAIPVTGVSGFPALNVSTVLLIHGTPMCSWIAATTSRAVGRFSCASARAAHNTTAISPALNNAAPLRLELQVTFLSKIFSSLRISACSASLWYLFLLLVRIPLDSLLDRATSLGQSSCELRSERLRPSRQLALQLMRPSNFHPHLLDHQAHHPYRLVILVTYLVVNRKQSFLFSLDFFQQEFSSPLQLLQEDSRPRLPGKRHPRQKRRTFSLRGPVFLLQSSRKRLAPFLRGLKCAALRPV